MAQIPDQLLLNPNIVQRVEDPNVKCLFCHTSEINNTEYGYLFKYDKDDITVHYFCILFSSALKQTGQDHEGIEGFLPNEIKKEIRRGEKLKCKYCKKNRATIGCSVKTCHNSFHFTCGVKNGTLHQFCGHFASFCTSHKEEQLPRIPANISKPWTCDACYNPIEDHEPVVWPPCCKVRVFHRICIQEFAVKSGYFFKCPACRDETTFVQAMKKAGVFVPERDAEWEAVPNAYQELTEQYKHCDAEKCYCPHGEDYELVGDRNWHLNRCTLCGASAVHSACGSHKEYNCSACVSAIKNGSNIFGNNQSVLSSSAESSDDEDIVISKKNTSDKILENIIVHNAACASNVGVERESDKVEPPQKYLRVPTVSEDVGQSNPGISEKFNKIIGRKHLEKKKEKIIFDRRYNKQYKMDVNTVDDDSSSEEEYTSNSVRETQYGTGSNLSLNKAISNVTNAQVQPAELLHYSTLKVNNNIMNSCLRVRNLELSEHDGKQVNTVSLPQFIPLIIDPLESRDEDEHIDSNNLIEPSCSSSFFPSSSSSSSTSSSLSTSAQQLSINNGNMVGAASIKKSVHDTGNLNQKCLLIDKDTPHNPLLIEEKNLTPNKNNDSNNNDNNTHSNSFTSPSPPSTSSPTSSLESKIDEEKPKKKLVDEMISTLGKLFGEKLQQKTSRLTPLCQGETIVTLEEAPLKKPNDKVNLALKKNESSSSKKYNYKPADNHNNSSDSYDDDDNDGDDDYDYEKEKQQKRERRKNVGKKRSISCSKPLKKPNKPPETPSKTTSLNNIEANSTTKTAKPNPLANYKIPKTKTHSTNINFNATKENGPTPNKKTVGGNRYDSDGDIEVISESPNKSHDSSSSFSSTSHSKVSTKSNNNSKNDDDDDEIEVLEELSPSKSDNTNTKEKTKQPNGVLLSETFKRANDHDYNRSAVPEPYQNNNNNHNMNGSCKNSNNTSFDVIVLSDDDDDKSSDQKNNTFKNLLDKHKTKTTCNNNSITSNYNKTKVGLGLSNSQKFDEDIIILSDEDGTTPMEEEAIPNSGDGKSNNNGKSSRDSGPYYPMFNRPFKTSQYDRKRRGMQFSAGGDLQDFEMNIKRNK